MLRLKPDRKYAADKKTASAAVTTMLKLPRPSAGKTPADKNDTVTTQHGSFSITNINLNFLQAHAQY